MTESDWRALAEYWKARAERAEATIAHLARGRDAAEQNLSASMDVDASKVRRC